MSEAKYLSSRDMQLRLDGTVVRWEDDYYYCHATGNSNSVEITELVGEKRKSLVDPNSKSFEARPPDLGWYYYKKAPAFAARVPYRRQRQGLSADSLVVFTPSSGENVFFPFGSATNFFNNSFRDMLLDKYPSISSNEMQQYISKRDSALLSKDFAICKVGDEYSIYHRTTKVARYSVANGLAYIDDMYDNSVIRNSLEELGVTCA